MPKVKKRSHAQKTKLSKERMRKIRAEKKENLLPKEIKDSTREKDQKRKAQSREDHDFCSTENERRRKNRMSKKPKQADLEYNSQFQPVGEDVTLAIKGIEPIVLIETTPSGFDETVESIAESTAIDLSSFQASTTCVRIEQEANELGNNQLSEGKYNRIELKLIVKILKIV